MNYKDNLKLLLQCIKLSQLHFDDTKGMPYFEIIEWCKNMQLTIDTCSDKYNRIIKIINKPVNKKPVELYNRYTSRKMIVPDDVNLIVTTPENSIDYSYIHYSIYIYYRDIPYIKSPIIAKKLISEKALFEEMFKRAKLAKSTLLDKEKNTERLNIINEELKYYKTYYPEYLL